MSERGATSNATGPRQTTKSGKTPRKDTTRKDVTRMGTTKKDTTPTTEQRELLRWVASLGAATAPALACRLDIGLASANARLSAARRRGLLSRERPLSGRPALFTLTRAGLRACDARGIEPCRVSASAAWHLIACASAAAALERCYPDHRVAGERELRRDEREQKKLLASARLGWTPDGERRVHRPDLVMWPAEPQDGPPVAVEVELTVKAPRRLLDICRAWARCRTIAGVVYLATPKVERALLRAVSATHASERIAVVPLSALPGYEAF
jgi:hypothetical protein